MKKETKEQLKCLAAGLVLGIAFFGALANPAEAGRILANHRWGK